MAYVISPVARPAPPDITSERSGCHLLDLPAELRVEIYKHSFATYQSREVDITCTNPPSNNLLLACRQICIEARPPYKAAYQAYWQTTHFSLLYQRRSEQHLRLRPQDVSQIRHMSFTVTFEDLFVHPRGHYGVAFFFSNLIRNEPDFKIEDNRCFFRRQADASWSLDYGARVARGVQYVELMIYQMRLYFSVVPGEAAAARTPQAFQAITEREIEILLGLQIARASQIKQRTMARRKPEGAEKDT